MHSTALPAPRAKPTPMCMRIHGRRSGLPPPWVSSSGLRSATAADMGEALLGLIATRIELLGIELREEALHLQRMLVLGVVAAFLFGSALVLAGLLLAAAVPDTQPLLALGVLVLLYAIGRAPGLTRLRSVPCPRPGAFHVAFNQLDA